MDDETAFDAYSEDGFVAGRQVYYATIYPIIREEARKFGYALALHGSLQRDLDVVAVPWVESAASPKTLAEAITERVGGCLVDVTQKPHGRRAYTIHFCPFGLPEGPPGGYIDLSVTPRMEEKE